MKKNRWVYSVVLCVSVAFLGCDNQKPSEISNENTPAVAKGDVPEDGSGAQMVKEASCSSKETFSLQPAGSGNGFIEKKLTLNVVDDPVGGISLIIEGSIQKEEHEGSLTKFMGVLPLTESDGMGVDAHSWFIAKGQNDWQLIMWGAEDGAEFARTLDVEEIVFSSHGSVIRINYKGQSELLEWTGCKVQNPQI